MQTCTTDNTKYFDQSCQNFTIDSSNDKRIYNSLQANNKYLNLLRIDRPSDTFYFRVQYSTEKEIKIFEFSCYKSESACIVYTFPIEKKSYKILFNKQTDDIEKYKNIFKSPESKIGLINIMKTNKILDLPDSKFVSGYPQDSFNSGLVIEFTNNCTYKIITYPNPQAYQDKFKEAKALVQLLNYLKKEFNF